MFSDFQKDPVEVKHCSDYGHSCTARLDGLNCVLLQHSEGIWCTRYHCPGDTILKLDWFDSQFQRTYQASLHEHTCTTSGTQHQDI